MPPWDPAGCGRDRLRATFTEAADLYQRARPGVPDAAHADMVALAGLPPGGRVLEIGCGTGQATLPLARAGCRVTAVELGTAMAALARRNLAAFPNVTVHTAAFEAWPLPAEPFHLVLAVNAWHWVDPSVRCQKAARALSSGGALAVLAHRHVAGGDRDFFTAVQACYERHMPGTAPGLRLPEADALPDDPAEIGASECFDRPVFRRYAWDATYSTAAYLELLNTYSDHRALDPRDRRRLLRCIARLIDTRFGGRIRKAYLTHLMVARRR